jgi:hypothetical protein
MAKFELSLSPDYVPSWTIVDAVRELFQNALDQQTTVEDNDMFFEFEQLTNDSFMVQPPGTLRIGNKQSVLQAKTLLLGSSSKADDPNTIGQFGEGYKVAVLVLLRNGKNVTFYNYGAREVWTTRFKQSRKYGGRILEFEIDKKYVWQKVPDNNLTIEVEDITAEEYESIVASNLHLQGDLGELTVTSQGRILKDERFAKKVFVNGLYVCDYDQYTCGYDFKPKELKLDRDRKMAQPFELRWKASSMWASTSDPAAAVLSAQGAGDVEYLANFSQTLYSSSASVITIANTAVDNFIMEHGEDAVPVSTQEELGKAQDAGKLAVMVPAAHQEVLKTSPRYERVEIPAVVEMSSKDRLRLWITEHQQSLSKRALHELRSIIEGMSH